jgi:hypothetical protein
VSKRINTVKLPPKPLFHAAGVPDDEILLAELIAVAETQKIRPVRGTRGTTVTEDANGCQVIVPADPDQARCCAMGTLEVSRQTRFRGPHESAVITGNDGNSVASPASVMGVLNYPTYKALSKWFQLGAAFIDYGRALPDGTLDLSI